MHSPKHPSRRLLVAALAVAPLVALARPMQAVAAELAGERLADALDPLLATYRVAGEDGIARIDYAGWTNDPAALARLREAIAAASGARPSAMNDAAAFAFWANLYNALTLMVVLDAYPVASIRDIRSRGAGFDLKALFGPWRTKLVEVEGARLSLDDIEHGIMRPSFADPRVHYAVNCAAIGCPNLRPRAWRPETLGAALESAARDFVNHPRGVTLQADGSLVVSSIYHWFEEDFGGSEAGVIAHLRRYAAPPLAVALGDRARIADHRYDWALNDARA